MSERKLGFSNISWESDDPNIRQKTIERSKKKIRMLELFKGLDHPDWCKTGHIGYVVEGKLDIRFEDETARYSRGDAIFICSEDSEKHIPEPVSNKVTLFLIEDI